MPATALVILLNDVDKNDTELVGGKGANLGELLNLGISVPNGFVVTVNSYQSFLKENKLDPKIYQILNTLDVDDSVKLAETSQLIRNLVLKGKYPLAVKQEIYKYYKKLSGVFRNALVAVRSSATAEDMPLTSFAGQQSSFMDIVGENNLLKFIKECWASLFEARSIFYRQQNKIPHAKVSIAVVVQKMVQSEASGVMFTVDPVKNDKDKIIIEGVWGLGDLIVQGGAIPDHYEVQKSTFEILSKQVSDQLVKLVKSDNGTKEEKVARALVSKQKISDAEVISLAKLGEKIQKHYFFPQDIEWAKEKGKIYLTQTRPITTLANEIRQKSNQPLSGSLEPILKGVSASPGLGSGKVVIIKSAKEIDKVKKGDVLVAPMTSPDYVPAMKRAEAIVTDEGGQTSHAAIVSRELGIPCVVGTKNATLKLKNQQIITVDGKKGIVYLGNLLKNKTISEEKEVYKPLKKKTATKLYVNLAEISRVHDVARLDVEGVGLLRAEFMIAGIGIHPKEAIRTKKRKEFIQKLADDLTVFCKAFTPKPIIYRSTDFRTNEYRQLKGGEKWEPIEPNPMLGFRGAFRYVSDPEVFTLELEAISKVRQKYPNLSLMIPFVRSPEELAKVRRLVASEGLFDSNTFKFWMMVELPINVIMLEDFIKVGIDGVSIGANDLTMLITGTDRDNASVAEEFNSLSPALLWSIKRVIKSCQSHGITSSICGQAPSVYDELVEFLVKQGITSISVNPDAVGRVRSVISETEKKIMAT